MLTFPNSVKPSPTNSIVFKLDSTIEDVALKSIKTRILRKTLFVLHKSGYKFSECFISSFIKIIL